MGKKKKKKILRQKQAAAGKSHEAATKTTDDAQTLTPLQRIQRQITKKRAKIQATRQEIESSRTSLTTLSDEEKQLLEQKAALEEALTEQLVSITARLQHLETQKAQKDHLIEELGTTRLELQNKEVLVANTKRRLDRDSCRARGDIKKLSKTKRFDLARIYVEADAERETLARRIEEIGTELAIADRAGAELEEYKASDEYQRHLLNKKQLDEVHLQLRRIPSRRSGISDEIERLESKIASEEASITKLEQQQTDLIAEEQERTERKPAKTDAQMVAELRHRFDRARAAQGGAGTGEEAEEDAIFAERAFRPPEVFITEEERQQLEQGRAHITLTPDLRWVVTSLSPR